MSWQKKALSKVIRIKARFVLSKSKALEQYRMVKELADEISYSLKTNPALVSILEESTEARFSVHFINSLKYVNDKKRIWFLAQSWSSDDIDILVKEGIDSFIVDNENDLRLLIDYLNGSKHEINLLLRMRLKERTIHTERHFVFGMYSHQINSLMPELRKNKQIKKLGIHFHRKSENIGEWDLRQDLEQVLSKETLEKIDLVNIGGGLPIKYKNHKVDTLPYIFRQIGELREWLSSYGIKMIIEPGRFIAGPAIQLEAEIENIYDNNIVINCSVYNSAMDTFVVPIRLLIENEKESGKSYTIKGCTPDSTDVFRYRVYLENPKVGDKLVFLNAGAYTYSTNFCNLEKLETVIVD